MSIYFKVFVVIIALTFPIRTQAQIIEPVQWTINIEWLNENEFDLVATATIDPDYYIFSTKMPEMAPLPTVFDIKTSEFFEAVGEARDLTDVELYYDDIFETQYKQFSGTASFAQTFRKLKDGSFPVTGEIDYMACRDGQAVSLVEDVDLYVDRFDQIEEVEAVKVSAFGIDLFAPRIRKPLKVLSFITVVLALVAMFLLSSKRLRIIPYIVLIIAGFILILRPQPVIAQPVIRYILLAALPTIVSVVMLLLTKHKKEDTLTEDSNSQ